VTGSRERLLIVDDQPAARATLLDYLGRIGYRPRSASTGREALALLRGDGQTTDAVVYDATLPSMGGRAFLQALRSGGSAIPVLLMTSAAATDREGADLANAVVATPFQLVDFGDRLLWMFSRAGRVSSS
jgi:CheY-like chemotaxis protein